MSNAAFLANRFESPRAKIRRSDGVREGRVELPRPFGHRILRLLRPGTEIVAEFEGGMDCSARGHGLTACLHGHPNVLSHATLTECCRCLSHRLCDRWCGCPYGDPGDVPMGGTAKEGMMIGTTVVRRVGAIAIAATTLSALILAHPTLASAGTPTCHGESATIVGTSGADNLHGTSGHDVIVGRGGNDVIDGRGGNDTICGGSGQDTLSGGAGDDRLYGGDGHDRATAAPARTRSTVGPALTSATVRAARGTGAAPVPDRSDSMTRPPASRKRRPRGGTTTAGLGTRRPGSRDRRRLGSDPLIVTRSQARRAARAPDAQAHAAIVPALEREGRLTYEQVAELLSDLPEAEPPPLGGAAAPRHVAASTGAPDLHVAATMASATEGVGLGAQPPQSTRVQATVT